MLSLSTVSVAIHDRMKRQYGMDRAQTLRSRKYEAQKFVSQPPLSDVTTRDIDARMRNSIRVKMSVYTWIVPVGFCEFICSYVQHLHYVVVTLVNKVTPVTHREMCLVTVSWNLPDLHHATYNWQLWRSRETARLSQTLSFSAPKNVIV